MINTIKNALKPVGLPVYFLDRGKSSPPCIVFSYTSTPHKYSNNQVESTMYSVLINLYMNGDFTNFEKEIKTHLKNSGFIEQMTPTPIWESEANSYNVAVAFYFEKYHF